MLYLNDPALKDSLYTQIDCIIKSVENALQILYDSSDFQRDFEYLRQITLRARAYHRVLESGINTCSTISCARLPLQQEYSGNPGRPRLIVNSEQVELLRSYGFSWEEVSNLIGISRTTLWRRLHSLGVPLEMYSDISDISLDDQIRNVQQNSPNVGLSMLQGYLRSQGIFVQRRRIRESVLRINPIRAIVRWRQAVTRRSYSVPGPNSL